MIARRTFSACVQMQVSSRVPFLGAPLVSCSSSHQAALQAASCLLTEELENGSCPSFPYETTGGQNIPPNPTRIPIWANNPPNQNTWLGILPSQRSSLTRSSVLCWSLTLKCFLHACTPERRTRALAHLFTQREHGHIPDTTKHILQKNVQDAETLGNDPSGGASKPHRSKYIGSALLFCSFYYLWRSISWKVW